MNQAILNYLHRDQALHTWTCIWALLIMALFAVVWILYRRQGQELHTTQDVLDSVQDNNARLTSEVHTWRKFFGPFPSLYENSPEAESGRGDNDTTIAIDLDGVILKYVDPWNGVSHFGEAAPGAIEAIGKLKELGYRITIYTARNNSMACYNSGHNTLELTAMVQNELEKAGIPYDFIALFKPLARYYIDDRAIRHTDWASTMRLLAMFESRRLQDKINALDGMGDELR
jgi:hypothetical protein